MTQNRIPCLFPDLKIFPPHHFQTRDHPATKPIFRPSDSSALAKKMVFRFATNPRGYFRKTCLLMYLVLTRRYSCCSLDTVRHKLEEKCLRRNVFEKIRPEANTEVLSYLSPNQNSARKREKNNLGNNVEKQCVRGRKLNTKVERFCLYCRLSPISWENKPSLDP